jgi:hypothetical protein
MRQWRGREVGIPTPRVRSPGFRYLRSAVSLIAFAGACLRMAAVTCVTEIGLQGLWGDPRFKRINNLQIQKWDWRFDSHWFPLSLTVRNNEPKSGIQAFIVVPLPF